MEGEGEKEGEREKERERERDGRVEVIMLQVNTRSLHYTLL